MKRLAVISIVTLLLLVIAGWFGLRVSPDPFPPFGSRVSSIRKASIPEGLPPPVDRFYRALYGDSVPVIHSAVMSGRATMRIKGIPFSGRFRFIHDAGCGYRHYIEATLFGFPVMKVNERYLEGEARMELPFGLLETGPKIDQGANLALWAEAMWFPSVYITDERVRWVAADDTTAYLLVPFEEAEERITVRFDPSSGMPYRMEAMRFKGGNSDKKILWTNYVSKWNTIGGHRIFTEGAVRWADEDRPWARFHVEEIIYNTDVEEYLEANGS